MDKIFKHDTFCRISNLILGSKTVIKLKIKSFSSALPQGQSDRADGG